MKSQAKKSSMGLAKACVPEFEFQTANTAHTTNKADGYWGNSVRSPAAILKVRTMDDG
jgi:hypothetical protein